VAMVKSAESGDVTELTVLMDEMDRFSEARGQSVVPDRDATESDLTDRLRTWDPP
jgi:hypothetical protein